MDETLELAGTETQSPSGSGGTISTVDMLRLQSERFDGESLVSLCWKNAHSHLVDLVDLTTKRSSRISDPASNFRLSGQDYMQAQKPMAQRGEGTVTPGSSAEDEICREARWNSSNAHHTVGGHGAWAVCLPEAGLT